MVPSFIDFPFFPLEKTQDLLDHLRGRGKQKILLVYASGPEAELDVSYAERIIGAVKLSLDEDMYLLPWREKADYSLSGLLRQLQIDRVLVFGVEPADLGLHFQAPRFLPIRVDGRTFLFSCSLTRLRNNREAGNRENAVKLWNALQQMFPIDPGS